MDPDEVAEQLQRVTDWREELLTLLRERNVLVMSDLPEGDQVAMTNKALGAWPALAETVQTGGAVLRARIAEGQNPAILVPQLVREIGHEVDGLTRVAFFAYLFVRREAERARATDFGLGASEDDTLP